MTGIDLLESMAYIDDEILLDFISRLYPNKSYVNRKPAFRMLVAAAVAVSIIAALGLAAYAISSIHQRRQEQLRVEYKVEENNVTSYVEYPEPSVQPGVSLVSAISDANTQRVYVNISPVSEETVRESFDGFSFGYRLYDGSMRMAGIAYDTEKRNALDKVKMYFEETQQYIDVPDPEQLYQLTLEQAYDPETKTLMLTFSLPLSYYKEMYPLEVTMISFDDNMAVETVYGTVTLELTEIQSREIALPEAFDIYNAELDKTGYIVGLTVYPIGATVYLDIPGYEEYFDNDEATQEEYRERLSWILLTDKIYKEFKLIFSDGSEKVLLGAMGTDYQNGLVCEEIQWDSTIDIDDVVALEIEGQRIALG